MKIKISVSSVEATAELDSTKTARKIYDSLPIEGRALRWGEEIYFYINVKTDAENPKQEVEVGDIFPVRRPSILHILRQNTCKHQQ